MEKPQKIMRILRESKEYSQEYVANVLNINQKTYSSIESGKSKLTVERINQLADLYHVKPDYFLSEELPIINYNSGNYSRSIVAAKIYNENKDTPNKLYERIISEKDAQIKFLINELEILKKEKNELLLLAKNLTIKINQ